MSGVASYRSTLEPEPLPASLEVSVVSVGGSVSTALDGLASLCMTKPPELGKPADVYSPVTGLGFLCQPHTVWSNILTFICNICHIYLKKSNSNVINPDTEI